MKRLFAIRHLVVLAVAAATTLMVSCFKDDIIELPSGKPFQPTTSEYIAFQVDAQWADEDVISRNAATRNRVGKHDLISEDGELSLPMAIYQSKGIGALYADPQTRGGEIKEENLSSLRAWATFTPAGEYANNIPGGSMVYIDGATFTKSGELFDCLNETYLWPGSGELRFNVLGNAPESITANYNTTDNGKVTSVASVTYTVPTDVTAQNDIIYAADTKAGDFGKSVELNFEHIMAAVNFKVGDIANGVISAIRLKGINNTGIYNFSNGHWAILDNNAAHKSDYTVKFSGGDSFNITDNTETETFINDRTDGIFMMIPQTVAEGATIEIDYKPAGKNARTLTASIAGDVWGKDIVTNYIISIDENYTLSITPVGKLLDAHYIIAQVEVTVDGMDDESSVTNPNVWQLTANVEGDTSTEVTLLSKAGYGKDGMMSDSNLTQHNKELSMVEQGFWCDKYVTRSGTAPNYTYTPTAKSARGTTYIRGTGNVTKTLVYVMIPENNSTAARNITLTLHKVNEPDVKNTITLTQRAPRWTGQTVGSYGWETVDDDEEGRYGFIFTRKIAWVYVYSHAVGGISSLAPYDFQALEMSKQEVFDYINNDFIKAYGATAFAKFDDTTRYVYEKGLFNTIRNYRYYIYLDYTLLNNLKDVESSTDGYQNTIKLNNMGGSASTLAFEQVLSVAQKTKEGTGNTFRAHGWNWGTMEVDENLREKTKDGSIADIPMPEGDIDDLSGILTYVLKKNRYYLYDPGDDGVSSTVMAPIILESDIKWYLPAHGQFATFEPNPNITDKNGGTDSKDDYWSSTAGENNENPANALSYNGNGDLISRQEPLGVIAVRVFDTDTKIIEAAVTVDNSSIAGGENGSTNNWIE